MSSGKSAIQFGSFTGGFDIAKAAQIWRRLKIRLTQTTCAIAGFPFKYELQGGWTIPKEDLKYLMEGPLAAEELKEALVPHALGWQRIVLLFKQFGPVVSGAIAIIGTAVRCWTELLALVGGLANAF